MRWITFAASGLGAIGLSAGTASALPTVVLEPLPWATAGFQGNVKVDLNGLALELAPTAHLSLHGNGVDFEADLVSRIDGNRWEYGLENITFGSMEDEAYLSIDVIPRATFVVPFDGIHPTSPVAFDLDHMNTEEDEVYESSLGIDWVNTYVAGDTVGQTGFGSIYWSVSLNSQGAETSSLCDSGPGVILDDCLYGVEIFSTIVVDGLRHPGPVAEPGSVLLLGAGAALGVEARRRRR